jgi:hypothetical protein
MLKVFICSKISVLFMIILFKRIPQSPFYLSPWKHGARPSVVPHSCNLSYSEGGDREDHCLRSAQQKVSEYRPHLNNNNKDVQCGGTPVIIAMREA